MCASHDELGDGLIVTIDTHGAIPALDQREAAVCSVEDDGVAIVELLDSTGNCSGVEIEVSVDHIQSAL